MINTSDRGKQSLYSNNHTFNICNFFLIEICTLKNRQQRFLKISGCSSLMTANNYKRTQTDNDAGKCQNCYLPNFHLPFLQGPQGAMHFILTPAL